MTVLQTGCSESLAQSRDMETCLEEHSEQSRADLWQVQTCLDAAKSTANAVEYFLEPPPALQGHSSHTGGSSSACMQ